MGEEPRYTVLAMALFRRAPESASDYDYEHDGELVFAKRMLDAELRYRRDPDWRDPRMSWGRASTAGQLRTLEHYLALTHRLAKGDDGVLASVLGLAKHLHIHAQKARLPGDDPEKLRQGQRLVTGIGRVWCARAPKVEEEHYWGVAGARLHQALFDRWNSDEGFAFMRVAGLCPMLLRPAVDEADLGQCCDIEKVRAHVGAPALAAALSERRVHVIPRAAYQLARTNLRRGNDLAHPRLPRYLSAPTAVFMRKSSDAQTLVPVGIDFDGHTVCRGESEWDRAKVHFQVADCMHHTYAAHLPQSHFVMEPIVIATRRCFVGADEHHPVARLLRPHMVGTIAVNHLTRATALCRDTPFSEFIASTFESTLSMAQASFRSRAAQFSTHYDRWSDEPGSPVPDDGLVHPFRDDYRTLRECLDEWVAGILEVHFRDDASVASDSALARWGDEIRGEDKGTISGFPQLRSRADLQSAVRTIIEIASIQHAAIHFPQTDLGRFAIVAPFYAREPPPSRHDRPGAIKRLATLPDIHAAAWQSFVLGQADVRWRTLDRLTIDFDHDSERAASERGADERRRRRITAISARIEARNQQLQSLGLWPYVHLLPSNIPCSVNQ